MKKKAIKVIFLYGLILISLICVYLSNQINTNYKYLCLWPITYTIIYAFIFLNLKIKKTHFIVLNLIIYFVLPMRYVVYPILVSFTTSNFVGIQHYHVNNSTIEKVMFFGIFELLSTGFFIYLLEKVSIRSVKFQKRDLYDSYFQLSGNKYIYFIYIIFAFILYILIGRNYNILNFITISESVSIDSAYITLIKYIIIIAICMTVLLIFNYCKQKYDYTNKRIYVIFSLFIALLFVCVIQGESRTSQVYVALIMILILNDMFPKYKKAMGSSIVTVLIIIIIMITNYREGDYSKWINTFESMAAWTQIYYGGPISLAQPVEIFTQFIDVDITNLIFDFLRSIFGLNMIFENHGYTTSQLYNLYLYSGQYLNGHVIFSISYGYIFFGLLGIPFTLCLNIWLATFFNKKFIHAKSFETKYLFGYCMLRMVSGALVNTPSLLGGITQYLGTFGLVILFSKLINRKSN